MKKSLLHELYTPFSKRIKLLEANDIPNSRKDLHFKDVTKRIPELQQAAKDLENGKISYKEYQELIDMYKPVEPYKNPPEPASYKDMHNALNVSQKRKF